MDSIAYVSFKAYFTLNLSLPPHGGGRNYPKVISGGAVKIEYVEHKKSPKQVGQ